MPAAAMLTAAALQASDCTKVKKTAPPPKNDPSAQKKMQTQQKTYSLTA